MVCTGACNFGDGCKCGRQTPQLIGFFDLQRAYVCKHLSTDRLLKLRLSKAGTLTAEYRCEECARPSIART